MALRSPMGESQRRLLLVVGGRGLGQKLVVLEAKNAAPTETEKDILAEWAARTGIPELGGLLSEYYRSTNNIPTADPTATDPGPWLETFWQIQLRAQGPAAYQLAEDERSFQDKPMPPTVREREELVRQHQAGASTAVQGEAALKERKLDEQLHGVDLRTRMKQLSTYLGTAVLCRPHGFSSVGHVQADSALGRLLLHGLHVFLATFHDPSALVHLHKRHCSHVAINIPYQELFHYNMTYAAQQHPSTFTGMLPPVAVQVPLFDHLSLHWQLKLVNNVMAGLMPAGSSLEEEAVPDSQRRLPEDHVYNWAAFNKLLLLGMYAPVEEAHAGKQHTQLVVQQLQIIAGAREAEARAALSAMQQTLAQFRCVLHDQLRSELAVGQATLQLFAAHQQDYNQQQQPALLKQLQQQLQECHLPAISAASSNSNGGSSRSSSSSSSSSSMQHSQHLVTMICSLLAWPLAVVCFNQVPQQQQQQQQQQQGLQEEVEGQEQQAEPNNRSACQSLGQGDAQQSYGHLLMQQLLQAVVSGVGPSQPNSTAPAAQGVRGALFRTLNPGSAGRQQQQQQQQEKHEEQGAEQLLISWLQELLVLNKQASSEGSLESNILEAARNSSSSSSDTNSVTAHNDVSCGTLDVLLQPFTRGVCHVLLVRLLSGAPPCEAWSWDACVKVLQLLVSIEKAVNAAEALSFVMGAVSETIQTSFDVQVQQLHQQQERQQQQQQQQQMQQEEQQQEQQQEEEKVEEREVGAGGFLAPGQHHTFNNRMSAAYYLQELLSVLQQLRQAEDALLACQDSSSSSSGGGGGVGSSIHGDGNSQDHHQQQQQQQQLTRQASGSGNGSTSTSRRRALQRQQQAEALQTVSEPTFWRNQALSLYRRKGGGSAWLPSLFTDVNADNHKPGFWGLVGKFAAADQLNLRLAEHPTALAAVPTTVLAMDHDSPASVDRMGQQVVMARQLARLANSQLMTKYCPAATVGANWDGQLVQPMALSSLMQCALLAARQPMTLAYANAPAAAAAAARRVERDADMDTFYSPFGSPEPGLLAQIPGAETASAAGVAAELTANAWLEHPGLHLSSILALGPMFQESQQGPCLVRFLQLLMQYHGDTAAAARAALQRLTPELQQRKLWVPKEGPGSSGGSNRGNNSSSSSHEVVQVPAERSRLLVLLMGLYHMQMLEEQQARQQQQRWKQAQRQREEEWGKAHGSKLGPQQQQQSLKGQPQQRQHLRLSRSASGSSAAAESASVGATDSTDVYQDAQLQLKLAGSAADTAVRSMHDLLLYCLTPIEQHCSSNAKRQGVGGVPRFEVCDIGNALYADGALIQAQPLPGLDAASLLQGTACDTCTVRQAVEAAAQPHIAALSGVKPPPATRVCTACGGHAYFCKQCAESAAMKQHQGYCKASGAGLQEAWAHALAMAAADSDFGQGALIVEPQHVAAQGYCRCSSCQAVLWDRVERVQMRFQACPMVQYSGPWTGLAAEGSEQQQQQQQDEEVEEEEPTLLPRGVAAALTVPPALRTAAAAVAAGGLFIKADADCLHEFTSTLWQMQWRLKRAIEAHEEKLQHRAAKGRTKAIAPTPQLPSAASGGAAAAAAARGPKGSSPVAAKVGSPAGLGNPLGMRRDRKKQQQQQEQQAGGWFDKVAPFWNKAAPEFGASLQAPAAGFAAGVPPPGMPFPGGPDLDDFEDSEDLAAMQEEMRQGFLHGFNPDGSVRPEGEGMGEMGEGLGDMDEVVDAMLGGQGGDGEQQELFEKLMKQFNVNH